VNLEEFYQASRKRMRSPETDFGVHWREMGSPIRWRVSYVEKTGELYAVQMGFSSAVQLLGTFRDVDEVEALLGGWADQCLENADGILWVRERCAARS
jgi:hypothetical protein